MDKLSLKFVALLLASMGIFMYLSAWNDAAIVDEDPHIGAGISYLTQQDMRINPEHPPLMKDLAALPLLFIPNLTVPTDHPSWTRDINGQWDFGRAFLFESGNNADLILHLSRIAPILITLLLGFFLYRWAFERGGRVAGFLSLFFFLACPVVLAHGRFVTTDIGAAAGIFIATYAYIRFLSQPTKKTLLYAGVAFGVAQLMKFSAILLIPFFVVLAIGWWLLNRFALPQERKNIFLKTIFGSLAVGLIGLVLIYMVYAFHVWHYPPERQLADTTHILTSFPNAALAKIVISMNAVEALRPLAEYLLGLLMVIQRSTGGNTTYFLGEVSASGWFWYFPTVYLIKLPLAFHILTLIAGILGIFTLVRGARACMKHQHTRLTRLFELASWKRKYFPELAMLLFIVVYWYTSLTSNLNIGVRHLLPTFPFVFALIALGIARFLRVPVIELTGPFRKNLHAVIHAWAATSARSLVVIVLLIWIGVSAFTAWPFYLTSFNELALLRPPAALAIKDLSLAQIQDLYGTNPARLLATYGASWAVDSNLDWGQDLKRLAQFVEERGIDHIAVDYFGWTPPAYYITSAEVIPWSDFKGQPEGWLAVSATYKQQACAKAVAGFEQNTTDYCFLDNFRPEAVIGGSIYVYHLPNKEL